jgi:hypothetical protein
MFLSQLQKNHFFKLGMKAARSETEAKSFLLLISESMG